MLSAVSLLTLFRTLSVSREEDSPLEAPPLSRLHPQTGGGFSLALGESSYRRHGGNPQTR
jgi:hypothetical protein